MNFLSPWFLLGAAALVGPILFHLIRRVVRERMPFSSLMFLKPTPPRVTRRRKLDNLLLLLLRCLVLLLLATAFARPFFFRDDPLPSAANENHQIVLLVDTSASMKRDGVWDKTTALVARYLEKALPGDQIALVTFDRQPHTLVSFTEWSSWDVNQRAALTRQRLTAVSPGWMGTQLGLAMTSAAEQFVDDSVNGKPASRRELVLISDLQEGAKLDGLQGHDWPGGMKVIIERVDAKAQANAGLEFLSETGGSQVDDKGIRVRVVNARDSDREKFQLTWILPNNGGPASEPMEIYLPPGQSRNFTAPKLAPNSLATTLCLIGDEIAFDNQSYFSAPETEHMTIAWFGLESANDPEKLRYYVERVFPETPRRQVKVIPPFIHTVFSPELLNQASVAVIPSRLTAEEVTAVRNWLNRGKTALLVLTDVQMTPTLTALVESPEIQVAEANGDFALLGSIDSAHPIFAPFADPRFSDFTHIHFWKHRRVEFPAKMDAHVLAKFDDDLPALTQISVGKGNLLVLASGWNPSDSQFAVSSKFPPFMQTLLDWSGSASPARFQFTTGELIPSPWSADGSSASSANAGGPPALRNVTWQKPDGKKEVLAVGALFTETDQPGIYTATYGDKQRHFAVNLSLDESRIAPLSLDEFGRLGVPLQSSAEIPVARIREQQSHLQRAELENHQKLWRWLIVGALFITFGEIILSGWLMRRAQTTEATV